MTQFTPAMETALGAANPLIFGALKIEFPDATVRLLDGAASLEVLSGETFTGRHAKFGAIAAIGEIEDGMGDEAPAWSFTLNPDDSATVAEICAPEMQGARVRVWLGVATRSTGAVVEDPLLLADLEIDVPTMGVGQGARTVEYDCVSSMDRLCENDEGFRLSDANHQRVWAGETGLINVVALPKQIYWGVDKPRGASTGDFRGGGGGGGGSGGGAYKYIGVGSPWQA